MTESLKTIRQNFAHRDVAFFNRSARCVARELLGDWLLRHTAENQSCGGVIIETEAYLSEGDDANHALQNGRTERNRAMFGPPGTIYVYMIYGMYYCMNIVCKSEGVPEAVLLRAITPEIGREQMLTRRKKNRSTDLPRDEIASGPGKLCMALDVDRSENETQLFRNDSFDLYEGRDISDSDTTTGRRVGVEYAENAGDWPLRYRVQL